jgi:NAD(P)-dependent dehydrogenase (short-subunit alcohol dehydrogenase family)
MTCGCSSVHGSQAWRDGADQDGGAGIRQEGIQINAVCPDFIRTPMVERDVDKGSFSEEQIFVAEPMHRIVKSEESAEARCCA